MSDQNEQVSTETGGGAYIEGSVSTAGGLFVGRDLVGYTAEQVTRLLSQVSKDFQPKPFDGRCPYRGLEAFGEDDADYFFGRARLVTELVERVKQARFFIGGHFSLLNTNYKTGLL